MSSSRRPMDFFMSPAEWDLRKMRVKAEVDALHIELLGPVAAATAEFERVEREQRWEQFHESARRTASHSPSDDAQGDQ